VQKPRQFALLKKEKSSYGGELLKTREGRARGRPLSTRESMHLVLRSSKARGEWSFLRGSNPARIEAIIKKFSRRYGVHLVSLANVGNHLHLHVKLSNRQGYKPFIRATTAAIAMAITQACRWRTNADVMEERERRLKLPEGNYKFWDYRPFTRVVQGFRAVLTLRDYIRINKLEGVDVRRAQARMLVNNGWRDGWRTG
jgi:REP element-mobilizing transposase RayT